MGKQYNKVLKRRRREAYLDRKAEAVKIVAKPKPKPRASKKSAAAPAASSESAPAA